MDIEMQLTYFRVQTQADGIAIVEMDVPGQKLNTLSKAMAPDLQLVLEHLEENKNIRGVVFASAKPQSFIAGADIRDIIATRNVKEATEASLALQSLMARLERLHTQLKKPVVAAIDGACLGGGLELALACSRRIATDGAKTQLGLPEVKLGLLPGAGGTQRLPRLIGVQGALDLILTGKSLRAARAKKCGLVDRVVPVAELRDSAIAEARLPLAQGFKSLPAKKASVLAKFSKERLLKLALEENPIGLRLLFHQAKKTLIQKTGGNYPSPLAALEAVACGMLSGPERGFEKEAELFGQMAHSHVGRALLHVYMAVESTKKGYAQEARSVTRVAIVGGGLMGAGIAAVTAVSAKTPVRIKELTDTGAALSKKHVADVLSRDVSRKRISRFDAMRLGNAVTVATDATALTGADLVIEAVYEDLAIKQKVLSEVEGACGEHTIYASNTSSLPITDIARNAKRPELVVGMHYFSPVEKMPLLEIITTEKTAEWVTATCVALGRAQGKTVIVVRDGPGFYTTRILAPYLNEGVRLVAEGHATDAVDRALMQFGFPVGPLTLLDEVGIDTGEKIGHVLTPKLGKRAAAAGVDAVAKDGRKGRKNGRGFYLYSDGTKNGADASVYPLLRQKAATSLESAEAMAERVTLMMVNEAVFCLSEKILQSSHDGDVGAIFGLGFPPFLGGPFHYIDRLGAAHVVAKLEALAVKHGERFMPAPLLIEHARRNLTFRDANAAVLGAEGS